MQALVPEVLQTARLRAERLTPAHATELVAMGMDPRVSRTLWPWPGGPTEADLRAGLRRQLDHWNRNGFGLWLLRDRLDGEMVGRGGLQWTDVAGHSAVEAAWSIVPARWGRGLATELALAAVATAFGDMDLNQVVAITLPDNTASRRVMEKAGFVYDRDISHAGLPHVLYRRRREPADRPPTDRRGPAGRSG